MTTDTARVPMDNTKLDVKGRPICCLCNKPLRKNRSSTFWAFDTKAVSPYGWQGNGFFCKIDCAAAYGVLKASVAGH